MTINGTRAFCSAAAAAAAALLLLLLLHVVRMKHDRLARQMLWAHLPDGKTRSGRQQLTIRERADKILKDLAASVWIGDGSREPELRRFSTFHQLGWVGCAQDRGLWRSLIQDHMDCLMDRTVRPARFSSRRDRMRFSVPAPVAPQPAMNTEVVEGPQPPQEWSQQWWISPGQEALRRSSHWRWAPLAFALSWTEEERLPQDTEEVPREGGFYIDSNGVRKFAGQGMTVKASVLPAIGNFVADSGVSYYRYGNGAIIVRPWSTETGQQISIPVIPPYNPPMSWLEPPWTDHRRPHFNPQETRPLQLHRFDEPRRRIQGN